MSKPRSVGKGKTVDSDLVQRVSDYTSSWDQAPSNWGHSLHALAPYVGGFPPELAHFFIRKYTKPGDTVLDPFAGGGTTPLEAGLHNRQALASDKFAYAACLSKAKCNPIPDEQFRSYLDSKLEEAAAVSSDIDHLLNNDDLLTFFSEYTLTKLLRLQTVLEGDSSPEAIYLNALVCGILHGPNDRFLSLQTKDTYSGSKNYVERYAERNDLTKPERDLRPRIIDNHELAQESYIPPWLREETSVYQSGSRDLPFESNQADLLVTSPPYLSKLDYTWNNWIRLWWLGVDRKSEQNDLDMTQDLTAYREFIRDSLIEIDRVLKDDSVAVLVVGDVIKRLKNRNEVINIASLIREEATEHTGLEHHNSVIDDYGIDGRSYVTANQTKYEYTDDKRDELATVDRCLVLTKGEPDTSRNPSIDWDVELYKKEYEGDLAE
ncbi:DNA methyltransferase [Natrinema altunense]|uniref:Type II methyltransferase n=1 Tax=Natrinema altunense TaxID=222984 RepID=A0A482XYM2_9EURY|nr:DNA methyltransferase [Natrinema altunense]RZH67183.1 DNA methylase [Natrinema altunense]